MARWTLLLLFLAGAASAAIVPEENILGDGYDVIILVSNLPSNATQHISPLAKAIENFADVRDLLLTYSRSNQQFRSAKFHQRAADLNF